ncbi:MAG: alr0857 family protein [Cyanobacteria bacterium P01_H01_bin.58]
MLKVTYTETGLYLEYCPQPLDLLLSDRVCMYVRAQQTVTLQPMHASIPLPTQLSGVSELKRFPELEVSLCDQDWLEITFQGFWLTEDVTQDVGIFVTELGAHLEQRLLMLWALTQNNQNRRVISHGLAI